MLKGIHHVGMAVADCRKAVRFFAGLGFREERAEQRRPASMLGPNVRLLIDEEPGLSTGALRPVHMPGITHICVQGAAMERLAAAVVDGGGSFPSGPVSLGGAIQYGYPRDPEGNVVEVEALRLEGDFPASWPAHVSVTVTNLARSIDFYERLTGAVARRSARLGPSAGIDRLTGLQGAVVEAGWLQLANLQLELLRYEAPPAPADIATGGYTRIAFEAGTIDGALSAAALAGMEVAACDLVDQATCYAGRDPDGNRIVLVCPEDGAPHRLSRLPDPGLVARVERARLKSVA